MMTVSSFGGSLPLKANLPNVDGGDSGVGDPVVVRGRLGLVADGVLRFLLDLEDDCVHSFLSDGGWVVFDVPATPRR